MQFECLESRRLFAVTLPVAKTVLPLTPANDNAAAPTVSVPQAAKDAALPHLADALDHFPDIG
jgi:hypothetical protein